MRETVNPFQEIPIRVPFPGKKEFWVLMGEEYDRFLEVFDISWLQDLTVRDSIVSYAILLYKLARKLNRENALATKDDLLLWLNIGLDYPVSIDFLNTILRDKLHIYLIVKPIRDLLGNEKTRHFRPTDNHITIPHEYLASLSLFQYPYYLLSSIAEKAELEGYESALNFLKAFMRLTQSLDASLQGKIKKQPADFIERLISLINPNMKQPEVDVQGIVMRSIIKYAYVRQNNHSLELNYKLKDDLSLSNYQRSEIFLQIHQELDIAVDPEFIYNGLQSIGDVIEFFECKLQEEPIPDHLIFKEEEVTGILGKILKSFTKEKKIKLKPISKRKKLPAHTFTFNSMQTELKRLSYKFYKKFPNKDDQQRLLAANDIVLPEILTYSYASSIKSLAGYRNNSYTYYDNISFMSNIIFTSIIVGCIKDPELPQLGSTIRRNEEDILLFLEKHGMLEEYRALLQSNKNVYADNLLNRILKLPKSLYDEFYAIYLPRKLCSKLHSFIMLQIYEEITSFENYGIVKVYPNDWLLIYFKLLIKWNLVNFENSDILWPSEPYQFLNLSRNSKLVTHYRRLVTKSCNSCGDANPLQSRFCENCGIEF
ncbi:MAG: zinc ribbon domain-containing protein [Candidatus Heimdallarchaeota archaeon]|nr:zinc ribbon domain-containing protein [Candidatus Heimdallarchaeota archaeon]